MFYLASLLEPALMADANDKELAAFLANSFGETQLVAMGALLQEF